VREKIVVPEGYKRCPKCTQVKPLANFAKAAKQAGGRGSWCGPCKYARDNETRFQRLYGINTADRDRLVEAQGGLCAICLTRPAVHVDHDHKTGRVRGVLCFQCNVALGHLQDDVRVLHRAVAYLQRQRLNGDAR
jgi:hypothetical protein